LVDRGLIIDHWRLVEIEMGSIREAEALKERTKAFAVRVVNMLRVLPRAPAARTLGRQAMRSGTSVAANYRAACRARSKAEFVSKIGLVLEEIDETLFWLELLVDCAIVRRSRMVALLAEANELLAIFGATWRTAKANTRSGRPNGQ
jgi:four helix bundle protein